VTWLFSGCRYVVALRALERATEGAAIEVRSMGPDADGRAVEVTVRVRGRRGFFAASVTRAAFSGLYLHGAVDVQRRIAEMPS
jgi:hypothetical protein